MTGVSDGLNLWLSWCHVQRKSSKFRSFKLGRRKFSSFREIIQFFQDTKAQTLFKGSLSWKHVYLKHQKHSDWQLSVHLVSLWLWNEFSFQGKTRSHVNVWKLQQCQLSFFASFVTDVSRCSTKKRETENSKMMT